MGSILIFSVRICQKPLRPFFHQGTSSFFTLKTCLCKPRQLPLSARLLCTRDSNPNRQADRRNGGQGAGKNTTIRRREGGPWGDDVTRGKSSTLRQRPSFPTSVFAAGTAKRTAEIMKRNAALASQEEEKPGRTGRSVKVQPPDRPLSAAEWGKLKESLGNPPNFDHQMLNAIIKLQPELDIAKSLLTFVATETGEVSYKLLLRYLTLCVSGGHDAEVFDVYDIMRGNFPSLDTGASTLFIKSFSRTARWREAISILHELKKVKVFSPSQRNYGDVIAAAMSQGDMTTAWTLYDELIENGLSPNQETWDALFKGVSVEDKRNEAEGMSQSEHQERLLGILLYMRNNQIYPQYSLASRIKIWFESLTGQKWTGSWTFATPKGLCKCCGSKLESIQLTADEYQQLKERVMTDVIQGQDIFTKTTPEELESFKAFVKMRQAFDVVIDGLNVANINRGYQAETLLAVVSELERRGLNILVLGRKHMLRPSKSWARHSMDLIQRKAHCFFTENISEDDPFLLYAALHSGNHCQFVSRDLMRDHKACLSDAATRRLFFKWQRGHQLVVSGPVAAGRRVQFLSIPTYDTIVQSSADSWHLPYDDTGDRSTYEVPHQWLCLSKKH